MKRPTTIEDLEAQAEALVRESFGQPTANLYVEGGHTRLTKERALAQLLEEDPKVYQLYRNLEGARSFRRALKLLGVEV